MTHICVSKITIIGSDNGLSPGRRQAIIWINAGILFIEPCGTWNLNRKSSIFIPANVFQNVVWKMAAILSRPQCVKASFGDIMTSSARHVDVIDSGRLGDTLLSKSFIIPAHASRATAPLITWIFGMLHINAATPNYYSDAETEITSIRNCFRNINNPFNFHLWNHCEHPRIHIKFRNK